MATEIKIPKLGMVMEEATVVRWLKGDGEMVAQGVPIVEIESEKITFQVEAPTAGVLHHAALAGHSGPIGALLGVITAAGEAAPSVTPSRPAEPPVAAAPAVTAASAPNITPTSAANPFASPAARRLAREHGVDLHHVKGSGPQGRIVESDVLNFLEAQKKPRVSPIAKKVAERAGVDIAHIQGSGAQGRILREDVERAALAVGTRPSARPPAQTAPMTAMRRTIARRMQESLHSTAQVTLVTECDVTELVRLRERLRRDFELTYTDLILQATARALEAHPRLNASLNGDQICRHEAIHIGVAVAVDDGLMVPVVRHANRKTLREIALETRDLAERARSGKLTLDELSGSTFSVTNLGRYGIDAFTPIINPPEAAILGVGRIVEKPAAYHGAVALRQLLTLSLTHDHRLVDGAPAAEFLQTVAEMLSMPYFLTAV